MGCFLYDISIDHNISCQPVVLEMAFAAPFDNFNLYFSFYHHLLAGVYYGFDNTGDKSESFYKKRSRCVEPGRNVKENPFVPDGLSVLFRSKVHLPRISITGCPWLDGHNSSEFPNHLSETVRKYPCPPHPVLRSWWHPSPENAVDRSLEPLVRKLSSLRRVLHRLCAGFVLAMLDMKFSRRRRVPSPKYQKGKFWLFLKIFTNGVLDPDGYYTTLLFTTNIKYGNIIDKGLQPRKNKGDVEHGSEYRSESHPYRRRHQGGEAAAQILRHRARHVGFPDY